MPIGSLRLITRPSYRPARDGVNQRSRNVCVAIGSLRLVIGDQLQGREAATAAPAHGRTRRTILTMRRTVRLTRVACASHAGLICPVTRAIKAAALRLVPLVVIAEAPGIGYGNADCRIHFWCTRGRSKVDFVLYRADGFHAIQVTTAARCGPPTSGASRHSTATPPPPSTASCSSCLPP